MSGHGNVKKIMKVLLKNDKKCMLIFKDHGRKYFQI